jgi:hypothetical protein
MCETETAIDGDGCTGERFGESAQESNTFDKYNLIWQSRVGSWEGYLLAFP